MTRDEFESRCIPEPNSGCFIWLGATNLKGYGIVRWRGRNKATHRVSYELNIGPIAPGLEIDHLCKNVACVNPAHLEAVTHFENLKRGNSVSSIHRRKTHCVNGHEFNFENTIIAKQVNGGPMRQCRKCKKIRDEKYFNERRYI